MSLALVLAAATACVQIEESPTTIDVKFSCNVMNASLTADITGRMVGKHQITIQAIETARVWHNAVIDPVPACEAGQHSTVRIGGVHFYPPESGIRMSTCITVIYIPLRDPRREQTGPFISRVAYAAGMLGLAVSVYFLRRRCLRKTPVPDKTHPTVNTVEATVLSGQFRQRIFEHAAQTRVGTPNEPVPGQSANQSLA